jgi:hypothetical protein
VEHGTSGRNGGWSSGSFGREPMIGSADVPVIGSVVPGRGPSVNELPPVPRW